LHLRIAGLTISVTSADPAVRQQCIGPSARFVVDDDGTPDLDLVLERVDSLSASSDQLLFDSGGVWRLVDDGTHYRLECQSYVFGDDPYKVALFDRSFTRGRLLLRRDVFEGDVDAMQYPLDEVIVGSLLAHGRGIELHGCGIIDERGQGRLFVGQSEAGKTTTAGLWLARGGVEIVSDDRVVVREIDGEWRMFGTPWHGEAELSSPSSAPLVGVYLLEKAVPRDPRSSSGSSGDTKAVEREEPRNSEDPEYLRISRNSEEPRNSEELVEGGSRSSRLRPLPPAEAAARLFGCAFPPFYDAACVAFTLECLDRLIANVPVRVLEFTRDASAVDAVLA